MARILSHALFLTPIGGIEVCTVQDARELARRGHQVDLLFGTDGSLRPMYEEGGVGLHGPVSFGFDPRHALADLRHFLPSIAVARQTKPEILWLNRFEHIIWAQAVARATRTPIVCQLHHSPNFRRVRPLSRGVSHFVAVSEYVRDQWVEAGLPTELISVIPNAVSPSDYPEGGSEEQAQARVELGLPMQTPIVLCYGRLEEAKGLLTLLAAWARVVAAGDSGLLLLVGSSRPDQDPAVGRSLAELPSGFPVRWLPEQTDMVPLLHAADVVVFPSHLPEAFGRVVIEGMSTARPVIAARTGAVPEILTGELAELLYDPYSSIELAALIRRLLGWRHDQPELGARCAAHVREHFPHQRHVDQLEAVLLEYARQRPDRR